MAEKKLFKFTKPNSSVKLGYAQSKESFLVEIKKFYPTATLADINHAKELEKSFKCFERSSELDKLHPDYSNNIADAWELMLDAEKLGLKPYIGWGFVKIGESEVKFEYLAEVPLTITKAFIEAMENLK